MSTSGPLGKTLRDAGERVASRPGVETPSRFVIQKPDQGASPKQPFDSLEQFSNEYRK